MEIKDTKEIQLDSLDNFMKALGYSRGWSWLDDTESYYNCADTRRTIRTLGFDTAVKLHNGKYTEWHGKYFNPPFNKISCYEFTVANASKIVKTVKLQYSKKKNEIKVMSHVVSFVKPEYYDLFLGD